MSQQIQLLFIVGLILLVGFCLWMMVNLTRRGLIGYDKPQLPHPDPAPPVMKKPAETGDPPVTVHDNPQQVIVTVVLQKVFMASNPYLDTALDGWDTDGWMRIASQRTRVVSPSAEDTLTTILLKAAQSQRERAEIAEARFSALKDSIDNPDYGRD